MRNEDFLVLNCWTGALRAARADDQIESKIENSKSKIKNPAGRRD